MATHCVCAHRRLRADDGSTGPNLYTARKAKDKYGGHPALRARHAPFRINTSAAQRWLHHMDLALTDVGIVGEVRDAMWQFFSDVALFLRNVDEEEDGKL